MLRPNSLDEVSRLKNTIKRDRNRKKIYRQQISKLRRVIRQLVMDEGNEKLPNDANMHEWLDLCENREITNRKDEACDLCDRVFGTYNACGETLDCFVLVCGHVVCRDCLRKIADLGFCTECTHDISAIVKLRVI